jgi:hypothetical protein
MKLAAIIVEDRINPNFVDICKQHLKFLPKGTDLIIYTSESTEKEYSKTLKGDGIIYRRIKNNIPIPKTISNIVGFDELLKNAPHLKPILNFCLFQTDRNFWIDLYEYDRVVTFHLDTAILREGIEEYLEWDWIGAPCYNWVGNKTIQNGALSIRNPRIMEYICRVHGWETDLQDLIQAGQYSTASFFAEDIFFCVRMIKYGIGNYPPIEIAKKFSVESKFELGTLGYHKISTYMSTDECKKIIQQYNKK